MLLKRKIDPEYFRNLIFGVQDGLVSTGGVLFGLVTATSEQRVVVLVGIITVLVEATSMGMGAYLSEKSEHELDHHNHRAKPFIDGMVMFLAYALAGLLCLFPYVIFEPRLGTFISVALTLVTLFLLGYIPTKSIKRGWEVLVLAGFALLIGFIAGEFLSIKELA